MQTLKIIDGLIWCHGGCNIKSVAIRNGGDWNRRAPHFRGLPLLLFLVVIRGPVVGGVLMRPSD